MHDVADAFTDRTGVEVTFNFASSHALARQIPASSKGDAYLSASEYWMDAVEALLVPGSRMDLLSNQLVLVRHQDSVIREIGGPNMRFLAIGDPAHVPVGSYAREWLRGSGLWERGADRLLLGPDARAVLAQAEGNQDFLAIVYRTDYLARSRPAPKGLRSISFASRSRWALSRSLPANGWLRDVKGGLR